MVFRYLVEWRIQVSLRANRVKRHSIWKVCQGIMRALGRGKGKTFNSHLVPRWSDKDMQKTLVEFLFHKTTTSTPHLQEFECMRKISCWINLHWTKRVISIVNNSKLSRHNASIEFLIWTTYGTTLPWRAWCIRDTPVIPRTHYNSNHGPT